ncbi:hypothetical protein [Lysobacter gummosus]|uniref:hypothetical protein n=1 Tax=Lysobacter gummosus TaxID=262324 RepID=UPI003629FDEE
MRSAGRRTHRLFRNTTLDVLLRRQLKPQARPRKLPETRCDQRPEPIRPRQSVQGHLAAAGDRLPDARRSAQARAGNPGALGERRSVSANS